MKVQIDKGPTDPICTRVSIGGSPAIGYYCTYRGTLESSIEALRHALAAMEAQQGAGGELPVNRQFKELGAS